MNHAANFQFIKLLIMLILNAFEYMGGGLLFHGCVIYFSFPFCCGSNSKFSLYD